MRFFVTCAALTLSAVAATTFAMVFMPLPHQVAASPAVALPPEGCHAGARLHFVPEFGRAVLHFHRVPDCAPIIVEQPNEAGPPS